MKPEDVPRIAALFHITTVESLPIWAFYGTFIANLLEIATFNYLWLVELPEAELTGHRHIGGYAFCVWLDINNAVFSLDEKFNSTCTNLHDMEGQSWNQWGLCNYICIGLCVFSLLVLQSNMFLQSNMDVCSGGYLVHKLSIERGFLSKMIAYGMVGYMVLLYACCIPLPMTETYKEFASFTTGVGQNYIIQYLLAMLCNPNQIPGMIVVIGAALSLFTDYEPPFDCESIDFQQLRFRRTWWGLLTQGSVNFMRDLERAVLLGHAGLPQELELLLANPKDVEHVLHVCRMRPPIDLTMDEPEKPFLESDSDEQGRVVIRFTSDYVFERRCLCVCQLPRLCCCRQRWRRL